LSDGSFYEGSVTSLVSGTARDLEAGRWRRGEQNGVGDLTSMWGYFFRLRKMEGWETAWRGCYFIWKFIES
jgi:hypothetical protein